jgi:hypothetical protein
MTFKFLSNENKGESNLLRVQNECKELIRGIIHNESYITTIYPQRYEFRGCSYNVLSIQYWFDESIRQMRYESIVEHGRYTVRVDSRYM